MDQTTYSPRITHLAWGRLETEDGAFKDARLFPGGAEEWDWNEPRSRHSAGRRGATAGARRHRRRTLQGLPRTPRRRARDAEDAGGERYPGARRADRSGGEPLRQAAGDRERGGANPLHLLKVGATEFAMALMASGRSRRGLRRSRAGVPWGPVNWSLVTQRA